MVPRGRFETELTAALNAAIVAHPMLARVLPFLGMTSELSPRMADWIARLLDTSIDHAVIFLDPGGKVVEWSGAARRLFGYEADEARGLPFAAIFTPEDLALGLDAQEIALASTSGRSEDDRWHVRNDGSRFWASGVLQAVRDDAGELLALCKIVRDRTDVRTQVVALQNQLAACKQQSDERDRSITSIAHELRNPMMPIFAAIALMQKEIGDPLRERSLEIVERQFGILKTLIDDLNEVARAEHVLSSVTGDPVVVQDALRRAAESLAPMAIERGQALRLVLPSGDIRIRADEVRLQQMLLNLIVNAIKYTPHGGHISLSATVEADMAVIRVEDDGIGIDPQMLPHIFELFTREGRDPRTPGDGVGLAVVKELARLLGGNVEARSPGVGNGSVFGLRLPLIATSTPPGDTP